MLTGSGDLQAQYDFLAGSYPVAKEDAAQLCALQIQAELGATLRDGGEALDGLMEKYMTKQVSQHGWMDGLTRVQL